MLCIGIFDGVHRGHQHLIQYLKELGGKSVLLTFSNHPSEILGRSAPKSIIPQEEKIAILRKLVDEVLVIPFTLQLAELTYEQFLEPYPIRHLVLGEGAALGRGRQGTPERLRELGKKRNFEVHVVPHLCDAGAPISSTRIRALLASGEKDEAERLLGRKL